MVPSTTKLAALASILLTAAVDLSIAAGPVPTAAPSLEIQCLHAHSRDLAQAAPCGDKAIMENCLSRLAPSCSPKFLAAEIERCFERAGCSADETATKGLWTLQQCNELMRPAAQEGDVEQIEDETTDLRRAVVARMLGKAHLARAAAPTPLVAARQENAAPLEAEHPHSPQVCTSNRDVTFNQCSTATAGPSSGKKECKETTRPEPVCREGLICQLDKAGVQNCMYKESGLGTAGIAIAIYFGVAVGASIFAVCFLCCRERRGHKKTEKEKLLKETAMNAAVATKKPTASAMGPSDAALDGQPLMSSGHGGGHGPSGMPPMMASSPYGGAAGVGRPESPSAGGNPFSDAHDGHPLR